MSRAWHPLDRLGPVTWIGIYDLEANDWLRDCFDWEHRFLNEEKARAFLKLYSTYPTSSPDRFELRKL